MADVTPTAPPKFVEVFGCVSCVATLILDFYVGVGAFVIGMSQISSFLF